MAAWEAVYLREMVGWVVRSACLPGSFATPPKNKFYTMGKVGIGGANATDWLARPRQNRLIWRKQIVAHKLEPKTHIPEAFFYIRT